MNEDRNRMPPYNQLNNDEAERLALLLEELGEAQQAVGKILRHGYESRNPLGPISGPTNRDQLTAELGHIKHAIFRMCVAGDLIWGNIVRADEEKRLSVEPYLHHQHPTYL